jgi:hypothetical protein
MGQFTTFNLPPLPAGLTWSLTYNASSLVLSTTTQTLLPSDIDLDGDVDRTDAGLFSQYFGTPGGAIWTTGDFNADGATTLADWGLLQTHLGQSAVPSPSAAVVPEPASFYLGLLLVGVAWVAAISKHRRRGS